MTSRHGRDHRTSGWHGAEWHGPHGRHGPPGAYWWRRRFLRVAIVVALIWLAFGVLFGVIARNTERGQDGPSGPPVVVAVVVAAIVATFIAYRRLARPVSDLLDGAERLGGGDYDARVHPAGPRAVRTLGRAFNDMAGRLEASEEARRRFLADITHELRTPLAVIRGEVEAQLDGIHARDDAQLTTLLDHTHTLERLIEDLHTLALGDAGQLTLHREAISVGAVVDDAITAIAATAARRSVTLTTAGSAAPDLELEADPVRLGQVVTNLLTNAVRHTPPGGTVTVTITADAGSDHGRRGRHGPGDRRRRRAGLRPVCPVRRLRWQRAGPDDRPPARRTSRRHSHRRQCAVRRRPVHRELPRTR